MSGMMHSRPLTPAQRTIAAQLLLSRLSISAATLGRVVTSPLGPMIFTAAHDGEWERARTLVYDVVSGQDK